MADRLRALLDRPLDPRAARAALVFASAILIGLAALFVLAARQPDLPTAPDRPSPATSSPPPAAPLVGAEDDRGARRFRQDPQDVEGSLAARRAARALRSHRALQHVPYRHGEVRITLVGARGSRAVLRVAASNLDAARRGWRRFLVRYRDSGRSYVPVFTATRRQSEGGNG
jgi:hypothetical protein